MQQRGLKQGFHAKRFKKFPRFSIYLQRDKTNTYLERNYISLNNRMLSFLAQQEPEKIEATEEDVAAKLIDDTSFDSIIETSDNQIEV